MASTASPLSGCELQTIRKKLCIGPKTKLLFYGYQDAVIMKKLEVPDITKELEAMYKRIDKRKNTKAGRAHGARN